MTSRTPRTRAEWVSLAGSASVVLLVVALIVAQIPGSDQPAAPVARVNQIRQVGDAFHVDVTVDNRGDTTAANVQVLAELRVNGEAFTGDQTIDFLSGGERRDLSFVFGGDPALGDLEVRVTGYAAP